MVKTTRAGWLCLLARRLPRYDAGQLRRDAVAGLTVATVAIPQGMAFALLAGISPVYGLFTAIVVTVTSPLPFSFVGGLTYAEARQVCQVRGYGNLPD
jgi:MFS superfamily sulfate permease-like transporter